MGALREDPVETIGPKKAKVGKKARTGQAFLILQVTGEKGAGRDGDQPETYVTSQDTRQAAKAPQPTCICARI